MRIVLLAVAEAIGLILLLIVVATVVIPRAAPPPSLPTPVVPAEALRDCQPGIPGCR